MLPWLIEGVVPFAAEGQGVIQQLRGQIFAIFDRPPPSFFFVDSSCTLSVDKKVIEWSPSNFGQFIGNVFDV